MKEINKEVGSYSVEAAFTLTVFMVAMISLMSIFNLMKVEGEVRAAINKTAFETAQYSYAVDQLTPIKEEVNEKAEEKIKELTKGLFDSLLPDIEEKAIKEKNRQITKAMVKRNFNMKNPDLWLEKQGVEGGFNGVNFSETELLSDGQTISIVAEYTVNIDQYGLIPKKIKIRNCAETYALLPFEYRYTSFLNDRQKKTSPWQESNFVRGRYFVNQIRRKNPKWVVEPGKGIDLYNDEKGIYVEVYSINLFSASYSNCVGDEDDPDSYSINQEGFEKQLGKYAGKLNGDIERLGETVKMADGSTKNMVHPKEKRMIIIVPEEVGRDEKKKEVLSNCAKKVKDSHGVTIEYIYKEKVFL